MCFPVSIKSFRHLLELVDFRMANEPAFWIQAQTHC